MGLDLLILGIKPPTKRLIPFFIILLGISLVGIADLVIDTRGLFQDEEERYIGY